ncbi:MAG TPA: zf-HC2 domain-containing protein [Candidatus Acidoferrales bacterium]|nr:zf-HC2 domain-containing protein [Candidatus Acidoferrales bacterium]
MPEVRNCARVRDWIVDAAAGSLAEGRRSDFDTHVSGCAACREEFQRAQALLRAIDEGVRARVAAEPSPQLAANIRQMIAEQEQRVPIWSRRNAWPTAASACAALAIFLFAAMTLHRSSSRPIAGHTRKPVVTSSTPNSAVTVPKRNAAIESPTHAQPRKPELVAARRKLPRSIRRHRAAEPEVIVQPGQMQAVLQFVAEVQKGKINGATIVAEIKASEKPLEIKPLVIPPLKTPPISDTAEGAAASNREQNLTSDQSN